MYKKFRGIQTVESFVLITQDFLYVPVKVMSGQGFLAKHLEAEVIDLFYFSVISTKKHHQGSSWVIMGHQGSSRVIKGHQASSSIIKHHQGSSSVNKHHQASLSIIKRHQASSSIIKGHHHHHHHQSSSSFIKLHQAS